MMGEVKGGRRTEGGRELGSGGLGLGSSSVGKVEKVNSGVWRNLKSVDCTSLVHVLINMRIGGYITLSV